MNNEQEKTDEKLSIEIALQVVSGEIYTTNRFMRRLIVWNKNLGNDETMILDEMEKTKTQLTELQITETTLRKILSSLQGEK